MTSERYVLLGLAGPRAGWFRTVSQWATSAMLPAEFVRCVSAEEVRIRLGSGRPFSAVIVDGGVLELDRDLIAEARSAGVGVLVVDDTHRRDWRALGAAAILSPDHSRDELLEVLAATSTMVGGATLSHTAMTPPAPAHRGELIAVLGPGGTGASTVAIALAQGLASGAGAVAPRDRDHDAGSTPRVLLADLCRVADQAMLHDARVVVPSIQEVTEAHRTSTPPRAMLLEQTFDVAARGYRLVLGLRRPRHWVALQPRAFEATLDSLQSVADVLITDVDADLEGEEESGSADISDRNQLTRASVARAALVVAVGEPSMKGSYSLVRTIHDLLGYGVSRDRILPVINHAPRAPRQRAELTTALAELVSAGSPGSVATEAIPPVFLPRRPIDQALRDGVALPPPAPRLLARAAAAVLRRAEDRSRERGQPPTGQRIPPGELTGFTSRESGAS